MIYLLLSILCNSAIYLLFKGFEKYHVRTFPAIAMNYLTACVIGLVLVPDLGEASGNMTSFPMWAVGGLALGLFFISVFYLSAITAQRVGVSVTTVASKMSMALVVVLFVITDPQEFFTWQTGVAVVLALGGVVLCSFREKDKPLLLRDLGWPLLILLGSTVVDFGIAFFSEFTTTENELALYSCLSVGVAGVCGGIVLVIRALRKTLQLSWRDVAGGALLGLVNYGSIYFLLQSYHNTGFLKGVVVCANNLGVVVVTALLAVLIFREKLTRLNIIGILLSILAIIVIAQV